MIRSAFLSLGLIFIIGASGFVLRDWVLKDKRPAAWDESIHTSLALEYKDRIAQEGFSGVLDRAYFNYPPLYHLTLALAVGKTEDIGDAGALINFFYLVLLVLSVFFIGAHLLGALPGLAAAFLVSCYPMITEMARVPMIDLSLTAWVSLSMLCLVKSENFHSPLWSMWFGISLGLAMLIKWSALVYVFGPFIFSMVHAIKEKKYSYLILPVIIAIAIMAPWYLVNFFPIMKMFGRVTSLSPASGVQYGPLNWLWYAFSLPQQLNLLFLLLLLPGLAACFWRPKLIPIFLWFLTPLILFSLIHNRNTRYAMPVLPAAAILSVGWLPTFRRIPFLVVLFLTSLFFAFYHFFPGHFGEWNLGPVSIPVVQSQPPLTGDWRHNEIIGRIRQLKNADRSYARTIVVSNAAHFHSMTLNLSAKSQGANDIGFKSPPNQRWMDFSEFILLKTGDRGPANSLGAINPCADFLMNPPAWFKKVYREVGRWPLPDSSEAILYHCEPQSASVGEAGIFNITLEEMNLPRISARGVSIKAVPLSTADTARGRLKELDLRCKSVSYAGVLLEGVRVRFVKPQINVPQFLETGEIHILSLERLEPTATIHSKDLLTLAADKAKWLEDPKINFDGALIDVQARVRHVPLHMRASVSVSQRHLLVYLMSLKIWRIPIPLFMIRPMIDQDISLLPHEDTPFYIDIGQIRGEGDKLMLLGEGK